MVPSEQEEVTYFTLLKNRNFRRFFIAQFVSSLGDWIGLIAIAVFAEKLGGPAAVGTVMTARVLPGFVVGPLAGVIADRWDRKRVMVVADLVRAAIIFSLPFVPNLIYLLIASALLESLTLIWGPAKDAALPNFVAESQLTHANSLSLMAIYGAWPLASVVYISLSTLAGFFETRVPALEGLRGREEVLALWADGGTFAFSAFVVSTLAIRTSTRRAGRLDVGQVLRDLVEGLKFIRDHKQVRPWLLGIGFAFAAAAAVFSLGVEFVRDVLQAGSRGFASLIGFLATGMILGLIAAGLLAKRIQKDILFSSSLLLLGVGLIGLASVSSLTPAIAMASALGFFAGTGYSTGYSLIQETTTDELRGRTFSAGYTIIRMGTLIGLGIFPFVAAALGDHEIRVGSGVLALPATRLTWWLAGLVAAVGGALSMRALSARAALPDAKRAGEGYLVVFEGGEGAGKSTQMEAFVKWLEARGYDVVTTREPGGTSIGARIRDILLDPGSADMDPRAEALLYAADRAQHVAEVIRPALEAGKVVVSDRFVDSSLAYQGLARGLGLEEIYQISQWGTGGMMPDVVFFLNIDARAGLGRLSAQRDRIERERDDFHERVAKAYLELAKRFPERFVVLDADRAPSEIHEEAVAAFEERSSARARPLEEAAPGIAGMPRPR